MQLELYCLVSDITEILTGCEHLPESPPTHTLTNPPSQLGGNTSDGHSHNSESLLEIFLLLWHLLEYYSCCSREPDE